MTNAFPLGLAYCGPPPDPAGLLLDWRLNPVVVLVMLAWVSAYACGARSAGAAPPARARAMFYTGWAILFFALVSPLCPLSVSLFSARAAQHVIITMIAAPLIAAARPLSTIAAALPRAARHAFGGFVAADARWVQRPLLATLAYAISVWTWHMPAAYDATFIGWGLYWLMHVTMFATAWWLWAALLRADGRAVFAAVVAGIAASVQMGFLGALITLSPKPMYAPHFLTTSAWGFTALQDQTLGGAILWIPGCTVYLVVATVALARCLRSRRAEGPAGASLARTAAR